MIFLVFCYIPIHFNRSNNINKEAIYAGYAEGTMIDYKLLLFEDSTYYLSTLDLIEYKGRKEWREVNDTIQLEFENEIVARLYKSELIEYKHDNFRCLSIMEIKEFDPPKIVEFPKNN